MAGGWRRRAVRYGGTGNLPRTHTGVSGWGIVRSRPRRPGDKLRASLPAPGDNEPVRYRILGVTQAEDDDQGTGMSRYTGMHGGAAR